MTWLTNNVLCLVLIVVGLVTQTAWGAQGGSPQPALRIVVLEGEASVNIVRQKTAVVPLVEVRDRNDQPVAGAVVTFAIRSGRAAFSGSRTLTVTTNAAGRAAATGLTPTGSGAVQIGASAAFQGQTAAVTIAQTNVMTAAEAAAASSAGASGGGAGAGSGASAGAGGGAGSGGLSGVAIAGIAGGAAAGVASSIRRQHGSWFRIPDSRPSKDLGRRPVARFEELCNNVDTVTATLTCGNGAGSCPDVAQGCRPPDPGTWRRSARAAA